MANRRRIGDVGDTVRATVKRQVQEINRQVRSRGTQAVNALRTAELEVLEGERSGKVYKKSNTHGSLLREPRNY